MSRLYAWVVTLYVNPGEEEAFARYERAAAAVMQKHGGRITRAVRCRERAEGTLAPYEIHLVEFPSPAAFDAYREEGRRVLDPVLRAQAICRTEIVAGWDVPPPGV